MTETPSTPEIVPGSPEYNAAMIARADRAADPATYTKPADAALTAMPEGGVDKFYDAKTGAYNWQAHAKELEWKLQQKPTDPAEKPADPKAEEKPAGDPQVPTSLLESLGLKEGDLGASIANSGDIPTDARVKLVEKGIPAEWIDEFVDNAKYRIAAEEAKMFETVGGKDGWNDLSSWAAQNLSEQEKVQVNAMLGDPRLINQGLEWLKDRRTKASPLAAEGTLVTAFGAPGSGTTGFATRREQSLAINDPRYRTDPGYRRQVQQRMAMSTYSREGSF